MWSNQSGVKVRADCKRVTWTIDSVRKERKGNPHGNDSIAAEAMFASVSKTRGNLVEKQQFTKVSLGLNANLCSHRSLQAASH